MSSVGISESGEFPQGLSLARLRPIAQHPESAIRPLRVSRLAAVPTLSGDPSRRRDPHRVVSRRARELPPPPPHPRPIVLLKLLSETGKRNLGSRINSWGLELVDRRARREFAWPARVPKSSTVLRSPIRRASTSRREHRFGGLASGQSKLGKRGIEPI